MRSPPICERRMGVGLALQFDWTDEAVDRLRAAVTAGRSYSDIAAELGISRNSAIGKGQRLGIKSEHTQATKHRRARPRTSPRIERQQRYRMQHNLEELAREPRPAPLEQPKPCTLLDLTATSCRWPLWGDGDAEKFYCGAVAMAERTYCAAHHAIAHAPAYQRQKVTV